MQTKRNKNNAVTIEHKIITNQGAPMITPRAKSAMCPGGYCEYQPLGSNRLLSVMKNSGNCGGGAKSFPTAKLFA